LGVAAADKIRKRILFAFWGPVLEFGGDHVTVLKGKDEKHEIAFDKEVKGTGIGKKRGPRMKPGSPFLIEQPVCFALCALCFYLGTQHPALSTYLSSLVPRASFLFPYAPPSPL
jgi:hypothetical protein